MVVETTNGRNRIPRQRALCPVIHTAVGNLPDQATRKIDAGGGDIGAPVAVEIRNDQASDRTGQFVGQGLPDSRPSVTDLPVPADGEDICFTIAIEIPEPQIWDAITGIVNQLKHANTAIGNVPMLPVGIKNIGAMVTVKIPDRGIA